MICMCMFYRRQSRPVLPCSAPLWWIRNQLRTNADRLCSRPVKLNLLGRETLRSDRLSFPLAESMFGRYCFGPSFFFCIVSHCVALTITCLQFLRGHSWQRAQDVLDEDAGTHVTLCGLQHPTETGCQWRKAQKCQDFNFLCHKNSR